MQQWQRVKGVKWPSKVVSHICGFARARSWAPFGSDIPWHSCGKEIDSVLPCHQQLHVWPALQVFKRMHKAIRQVPAEADRRYLKDWAREEFRRNKDATEEDAVRMMITQGNMQLQELERTLKLAKS
ncbi:PREDICTED: LYR motif-containing protein 2 [Chaetura pelagica]|uniref:LYR motif-containing protein 2 n=1 Tax=Chaetura pelagica TaxID=8897 RepID=UPI000523D481|nr:PREDICTED: LYR motif-containing protein 2 [Chaetura pelagica]